jgi:regulator of ribosome biosynthesis
MDIVTTVLEAAAAAKQANQFKRISDEKQLELGYDLRTLLAVDTNNFNFIEIRFEIVFRLWLNFDVTTCGRAFDLIFYTYFRSESCGDKYMKDLARDNTQHLLKKIWELPTETVEEAIVAKLAAPTFRLPKEKPLPKSKPSTK